MSLLLQALQKAAKSREEGEVELSAEPAAMTDEFTLEPASPGARVRTEAPPSPTSAQAATLIQAGSAPAFDVLDYAREHYMLSFVGVAFLVAVAYGTYVYWQVNRPFRSSAPALVPIAQSPQTPVATSTPPSSASAKISGMPGGPAAANSFEVAGPRSTEPAAAVAEPPAPPANATSVFHESTARAHLTKGANPLKFVPGAASVPRQRTASPALADASDSIETVVIPSSHGKPAGDISVHRDAAGIIPVSPTLLQAYESLQRGDNAQAKGLYEQVLQADPRNMDALLGLGVIALNDGRTDDASRFYQQVLELDPRNSYAQAGLISIIGGSDPQASESRMKLLIARDPSAFLYFCLGNLYAEQGQWSSAQQAYMQAFQMQQDSPDYAFNLAIGLEHLGQKRIALDYYRKALDLSFKKGHASFDQSLVIQRVGQLSTHVEQ